MLWFFLAAQLAAQITTVGNQPCQECHRNISRNYARTEMASNRVNCEDCHGPASQHIQGSARLIVPTALEDSARDSICGQCHLKDAIQIQRPGRKASQYRPGAEFGRYVATLVGAKPAGPVDGLNASKCRQKAGADLWCASCHDVHTGKTERAAACQSCHTPQQCKRGPDCAKCHMPQADHRIVRPGRAPTSPPATAWQLRPFSAADRGTRELGLAYAEAFARTRDARQQAEAVRLLSAIAKPDPAIRTALAKLKASPK